MAKDDDWYWRCEPALVLSDEDLALLRTEDWPDEGLSAVGLYFYMLCLMHRSPRRGYLLGPDCRPLTTERLALLVRRSLPVVDRLQHLLLSRNLFSVSAHGEIYSRGMVRREGLRIKRRDAGKKGGVASGFAKANGQANGSAKTQANAYSCSDSCFNSSERVGGLGEEKTAQAASTSPGYHPEKLTAVRRILAEFAKHVRHGPTRAAESAVIGQLIDGRTEAELIEFSRRAGEYYRREGTEDRYRPAAASFYGDGGWLQFADGVPVNGKTVETYSETMKRKVREARAK